MAAAPSDAVVVASHHDAASATNGEDHEDGDKAEEITDAQGAAILIIWVVSFVLFFVSIRWMVAFWLIALGLASIGIVHPLEDVVMSIVTFVAVMATLMWMGVREILGGGKDGS